MKDDVGPSRVDRALHLFAAADVDNRPLDGARLLADLVTHASTAGHFNAVAWAKAQEGKLAVALAYAKKSVEKAPLCAACVDTLAYVAHAKGDLPSAIKLQRRAVSLLGEGKHDPRYEERLREYEEELRTKGGFAAGQP